MRTRCALFVMLVAAWLVAAAVPSVALGAPQASLTNEYGMALAGQAKCIECHNQAGGGIDYDHTLHGRHVTSGLPTTPPTAWTQFAGSGSVQTSGAPNAGSGLPWFTAGGTYSKTGLTWMTMFDYQDHSRWSEEQGSLMFFSGSPSTSTASPWNRISGLGLSHTSPFYDYLSNTSALSDAPVSSCGMVNCHFTGGTQPLSSSQTTWTIPNPAVRTQPTTQTPTQWARSTANTAGDFRTTAAVGYDGLGVQCEKCHGSGLSATTIGSAHWNTGTQLSHRLPAVVGTQTVAKTSTATLGRSDVCGACHGLRSATAVTGVLPNLMGYTPNLFVRSFVSVNASRSANAPYTYTPTDAQFASTPAIYSLYPNGNPKSGGHGGNQYWAWAASAHAVRVQTGANDPDQLPGAKNTHFSINGVTTSTECLRCHTGEGYLTTKVPQIADRTAVKSVWDGFEITKTSAGFLGQECVTCHDPHPASAAAEDSIRSADPAGKRSNYGRSTANASMCEDCHNWQVEVMANSLPLTEFSPQSLPGRVSHAQREVLHGTKRGAAPVMWDVADMGEFMPGATCQDCHMPKTDTSAEYSSHGMKIQTPGDAATWGATGEDSCTKCHEEAGVTVASARSALQANLDGWQTDATAAGTAAKAAIDGAKLRAEYTGGGVGAKELYGRAWLNWSTFSNDLSNGAHNPPYIMAGLTVAQKMAKSVGGAYSQIFYTPSVNYGGYQAFSSQILNGDGSGAAGAEVALERRLVGGGWSQQDSATTDRNGNVSFVIMSAATADYRLRWDRCSNDNADLYSGARTITVVSYTSARSSRSSVKLRKTFVLSGSVTPNQAGGQVRIQARKGGKGAFRTIYANTLSASSTYARSIKPGSKGSWYYRVVYSGSNAVAGSTSPTVRVVCK